jgi:hypothetical protein
LARVPLAGLSGLVGTVAVRLVALAWLFGSAFDMSVLLGAMP